MDDWPSLYSLKNVDQYVATRDRDIFPESAGPGRDLARSEAMGATLYGLPAVLHYGQMCSACWDGESWSGMNRFSHDGELAGPDYEAFRVPNVDTLYSNAWFDLGQGPVAVSLPDFGDRYFTLNLLDIHGNASNYSMRTHGRGPHQVLLATGEWPGQALPGQTLFRVATPVMWGLLRIQLLDTDDIDRVRELQEQCSVTAPGGNQQERSGWPVVDVRSLESDWSTFMMALDAQIRTNGVPHEELALVRGFRALGVGAPHGFNTTDLPEHVRKGAAAGFEDAFALMAASRAQLGQQVGGGWTRVANKGRHGTNYTARAVMNFVGLGANVVEENTSFNAHVDRDGKPLDGTNADYALTFVPPPVDYFWSVTLYDVETGRVCGNPLDRYAVGRAANASEKDPAQVTIHIQHEQPQDITTWLPAPSRRFFLVLRAYGPRRELLEERWTPPGVERIVGQAQLSSG